MHSASPFQLIIYAKNPLPGQVKTRLAKGSNQRYASQAYKRLLTKSLSLTPTKVCVTVATSPHRRHGYVRRLAQQQQHAVQLQPPGDLGRRMSRNMRSAAKQGFNGCIIIGSDCPAITEQDIENAIDALQTADLYLLPANDGGYALIACRDYYPALFRQVDWSTPQLLRQTLRQARAADLKVKLGRNVSDVDQYPDWRKARKLKLIGPLWRRC